MDFMEVKLGSNPSFIWRSIMEARRVISSGSSWRIDTGNDIKIVGQSWLNNEENSFITTTSPSLTNQHVSSLFRTDTNEWDMEVVTGMFDSRDQQCIARTRVEHDLERDIICWKLELSGQYSVKSAYKLLQEEKGACDADNNIDFWKRMWNIKAPLKALKLVWRAASYCLPTKVILQSKHVQVDNVYPICNEDMKIILHNLVQCEVAARCWQIRSPNIITVGNMEFSEWLERNIHGQLNQTKAKIITLYWSIWRSRDDCVWNNKRRIPMRIVAKAWEFLSQWTAAQGRNDEAPPLHPPEIVNGAIYWIKPHFHEVKITVDVAILEDQRTSGIGLVARNHDGHLVLAKTKGYAEVMNPTLAEVIAVKEVLSWAKEMADTTVFIKSDCLVVMQLIRLYFIKRSTNMTAHELAPVAHIYPDRTFDWRSVPINVKTCISNELME